MARTAPRTYSEAIHPLHAVLLAGALSLFLGAMLSDVAYANTYEIQWNNFASWLIVGGLVFSGIALLFAIADVVRAHRRVNDGVVYFVLLLLAWSIGFLNALMHARDAWASMPGGLVMSVIVTLLVCAATWFGFRSRRTGVTQ